MTTFIIIVAVIFLLLVTRRSRQWLVTSTIFRLFKTLLPPLSKTEREAMAAGTVWWEGELFKGKPDWNILHSYPAPKLSSEEQSFLDNEVQTLLTMLDDYTIVQKDKDLPPEVWDYLKNNGFFAMIIAKEFGGLAFSAFGNSTVVTTIATKSLSAAVTVMVPNSLGPGELLMHYGTAEQKQRWLPGLANGTEIPCFALTGPEAGSDAGSIPDIGIVCKQEFEGQECLGISLNWDKRYITLSAVATVLGLAFKLKDPEQLLGDKVELGITCALIPTAHPGVIINRRHYPLNLAFINGPTTGKDVFIPLDWVIGAEAGIGKGWPMLVECLSAGRGISLPALGAACGHLTSRTTGAYAYVRKQFGLSIGKFEGVAQQMGRIGGYSYQLEACRRLTCCALDQQQKPAVVTAIAKYHMTEMARTILNDAMDIHAGRAIQVGPMNYLAHVYYGIPVAITVEGANILTRNLMIFGQGATRCHPFVLKEMAAADEQDYEAGLRDFDRLLVQHSGFAINNGFAAVWTGLTSAFFENKPVCGETGHFYQDLSRMSRALALLSDMAMLELGGELKRKESLSARLGDVLSHLYLASATLKFYEDNGHQQADLPFVTYAVENNLYRIGQAIEAFLHNLPSPLFGKLLKLAVFPLGNHFNPPKDHICHKIASELMKPGISRDRVSHLCYVGEEERDPVGNMERAFLAQYKVAPLLAKVKAAQKSGELERAKPMQDLFKQALEIELINNEEFEDLSAAEKLRSDSIQVDSFSEL